MKNSTNLAYFDLLIFLSFFFFSGGRKWGYFLNTWKEIVPFLLIKALKVETKSPFFFVFGSNPMSYKSQI